MKKIIILMLLPVLFAGCRSRGGEPRVSEYDNVSEILQADMAHSSENALNYAGTYTGVLPCADCEGIETKVTLSDCNSYVVKMKYLGKGDTTVYQCEGPFFWDRDGRIITLDGANNSPRKFQVGENILFALDTMGNRIEGALAGHYILSKDI